MTKKETTLAMLTAAADRGQGVTNRELNDAGVFRYSARIAELRSEGFTIETIRRKKGLFEFRLASPPCGPVEGATGVVADTTHPGEESLSESHEKPSADSPPALFACDLNDSPYY